MPLTHGCFLVACLAIAGIPPFSGFFSKDEILLAAFHSNRMVYGLGLFTAGLTAFYMFRLYFSVFWRRSSGLPAGPHQEAPISMKVPLVILAAGALLAGFVPFSSLVTSDGVALETHAVSVFAIAPVALALMGIIGAGYLYGRENQRSARITASIGGLYRLAYHKFYIDEIYTFITKKIIFNLVGRPAAWIDRHIVDGFMNGLAEGTARIAAWIKGFQSGRIQDYTLYFLAGIGGLAVLVIYIWKS
jgi:NADH-quinone oxidoreductase subunit L